MNTTNEQGILRTAAVLQVNSRTMQPMIDFFVDQLGFSIGTTVGNGPSFATLDRDEQTIILNCVFAPFSLHRTKGWAVYFWVGDVDVIYNEFIDRNANLKGAVVEKPYGCREVIAVAPDGREIVFGQLVSND